MSKSSTTLQQIEELLTTKLTPELLEVIDDSHLHKNHPASKLHGGGHFTVRIKAEQLSTINNKVKQHQLIYQILSKLLQREIHALSIKVL